MRRSAAVLGSTAITAMALSSAAYAAEAEPFGISGNLTTLLFPGGDGRLDLKLDNHHSTSLEIFDLRVAITGLQPLAGRTCSTADFAVDQYSPSGELVLDSDETATLTELGLTQGQLPRVRMLETGINQDGCQGATLLLAYTGSAIGDDDPSSGSGDNDNDNDNDDAGSDDVGGVDTGDLPGTGGSGNEGLFVLGGLGLLAAGGGATYVARRRRGARA